MSRVVCTSFSPSHRIFASLVSIYPCKAYLSMISLDNTGSDSNQSILNHVSVSNTSVHVSNASEGMQDIDMDAEEWGSGRNEQMQINKRELTFSKNAFKTKGNKEVDEFTPSKQSFVCADGDRCFTFLNDAVMFVAGKRSMRVIDVERQLASSGVNMVESDWKRSLSFEVNAVAVSQDHVCF